MKIHEYQAKALLAKFAVPLLKGGVAYTKDEAMDVARKLGGPVTVVKAQIHAGGRGKGRFKLQMSAASGRYLVHVFEPNSPYVLQAQALQGLQIDATRVAGGNEKRKLMPWKTIRTSLNRARPGSNSARCLPNFRRMPCSSNRISARPSAPSPASGRAARRPAARRSPVSGLHSP